MCYTEGLDTRQCLYTIKVSAKTKEPPWYWTVRQVVWEVGDFGRLLPDMVVNTKYFTYKCRFTKAVK